MSLLLIERAVLECIGKQEKSLHEISEETGIKMDVVERIISRFLKEEVLYKRNDRHIINNGKLAKVLANKMKGEVGEIFDCFCDVHFSKKPSNSNMKLKKIVLNKCEQQYFESMWKNMEDYLKRVERESKSSLVKDQTVIFWGWSEYSDMIDQYMKI